MNQFLSDKIRILSFVSIIFVLYIHSSFNLKEVAGMNGLDVVVKIVSGMLGNCAVPLFFVISGYLFFYNANNLSTVFRKIKKRVNTLVIPYIVASVFFIAFYIVLEFVPGAKSFMNSSLLYLLDETFGNLLKIVFIADIGRSGPLAFHLWFLRDLIMIVALAPLLYLLNRYLKWYWLPIVFALNFYDTGYFPMNSLFWFGIGYYFINMYNRLLIYVKWGGRICLLLFIISSIWLLFFCEWNIGFYRISKIVVILLGLLGFWNLYDKIIPKSFKLDKHRWLQTICSFTFFIYLFHEPTLNIVKKVLIFVLGKSEISYLFTYLVSPWVMAFLLIAAGMILKRYISAVYWIMVGGR